MGSDPIISYQLPASAPVSVRIHDVTGSLVKTLIGEHQEAGDHSVPWDGRDERGKTVPAGIYFYRIEAAGAVYSGKAALLR